MLFNIVGTIASGKTTFIRSLNVGNSVVFEEPVSEWAPYFDNLNNNFCPETILELQEKIYEYYHSVLVYFRENPDATVFMERCHLENIFCFILPITLGYNGPGKQELVERITTLIERFIDEYKELKTITKISNIFLPTLNPTELVRRKDERNQPNDKYLTHDFFIEHVNIYKRFINIFGLYEKPGLRDYNETDREVYEWFFKKCEFF